MSEWVVFGIVAVIVAVLVALLRFGLDEEERPGPAKRGQTGPPAAPPEHRP